MGISLLLSLFLLAYGGYRSRKTSKGKSTKLLDEVADSPRAFRLLFMFALGILLLGLVQSFYPPHLSQEQDAINYHMALPRQHLLHGTLGHIPWSAADLFPQVLSFGLAPYWFLPEFLTDGVLHKIPQWIGTAWVFFTMVGLGRTIISGWKAWIPALALVTTHGFSVQSGTAMLDHYQLYFLLALVLNVLRKETFFAALHFALFMSAKSYSPVLGAAVLGGLAIWLFITRFPWREISKWRFPLAIGLTLTSFLFVRSAIISKLVSGSFLFPLFVSSGTPVFETSRLQIQTRTLFGLGHDPFSFLKHIWLVAVPNFGTSTNAFDYPLGLGWLLGVLIFSLCLFRYRMKVSLFHVLAALFWCGWWAGSHQSRWLYPVIAFFWLGSLGLLKELRVHALLVCLNISALLSFVSLSRAYQPDFLFSREKIQSRQIAKIASESKRRTPATLNHLYFDFPIRTHDSSNRYWILRERE